MRRFGRNLLTIVGALAVFALLAVAGVLLIAFLVGLYEHFTWDDSEIGMLRPGIDWLLLVYILGALVACVGLATLVSPRMGRNDYCPQCPHCQQQEHQAAIWLPPQG